MNIVPILIAGSGTLCIAAIAASAMESGSDVTRHLAALDQSGIDANRHQALGAFGRAGSERRRNRLGRKLVEAGWYQTTASHLMVQSALGAAAGFALAIAAIVALRPDLTLGLALAAVVTACGAYYPYRRLDAAIAKRKRDIARALPDFLDLVATSVRAGTALGGALASSAEGMRGPLRAELDAAVSDVRLGRSRADALVAMAGRAQVPDLTTTVTAIVQSEKLGGDIAQILDELAHEARERRILRAEEHAASLPVKMTLPMALCMLPALMAMIFGSVAAQVIGR